MRVLRVGDHRDVQRDGVLLGPLVRNMIPANVLGIENAHDPEGVLAGGGVLGHADQELSALGVGAGIDGGVACYHPLGNASTAVDPVLLPTAAREQGRDSRVDCSAREPSLQVHQRLVHLVESSQNVGRCTRSLLDHQSRRRKLEIELRWSGNG